MVIALGTFVAFTFLMTAPSSLDYIRAQLAPEGRYTHGEASAEAHDDHGDDHGLGEDVVSLIESDGASRDLGARLTDTRPRDARVSIEPPPAPSGGWTLAASPPTTTPEAPAETPAERTRAGEDAAADEASGEAAGEGASAAEPAPEAQAAAWDRARGESVYSANCASCHQGNGQGIPGAFPPLAGGHAPDLLVPDGGRTYLIDVLLYGLQGQIEVEGQSYNGVMPAWAYLSDDDLAAVINHVLHAWDNADALPDGFSPFVPDEIADQRGQGLAGSDVLDLRGELDLP
jgi:mono/diheme cytochrome c family protein